MGLVYVVTSGAVAGPRTAAPTPPGTTANVDASLGGQIDVLLASPIFADAQIGIHVLDLATNKTVYEHGADLSLNPASNTKLVTTAAALHVLGPQHRYSTRIFRGDGTLSGSAVSGNLYLRGSGDPALVTEDLDALAAELRSLGIRRFSGGIVLDTRRFDQDELPPGFDQKNEMASYRAPSSAASINYNTFVVRARPGKSAGETAVIGVDPPIKGITIVNETKTVPGRKRRLFADVEYLDKAGKAGNAGIKIRFHGNIGIDASNGHYRYPVRNPTIYTGQVLALALKRHGIKLGRRKIKTGKVPNKARALATHSSPPVGILIRSVNKFSNNFMAEQMLKSLDKGKGASFADALSAEKTAIEQLGIDLSGARMGNGSGLYDTNRYTPQQLTALLAAMYGDFRYRAEYLSSLATMGVDGTTRSRLRDTDAKGWIRVKTGTLDGISALSGYVGAPGRRPLAFSILFNDLPKGATSSARTVQNEIALLLSRFAAGQPLRPDAAGSN